MRKILSVTLIAVPIALHVLSGCNNTPAVEAKADVEANTAMSSEQGAWLGTGTFYATEGTQEMKAQLELLSDGSYRFIVLEPRILMVTLGLENGTWSRTDQQLSLTPHKSQSSSGPGLLSNAPKDFRPKSLVIEGNNTALILKDEQMDMRFEPNPKATAKLKKSGEIK